MRPAVLVGFLALPLLALAGPLPSPAQAQTLDDVRIGARIRIQDQVGTRNRTLTGTLLNRSSDTVRLRRDYSRDTLTILLSQVQRLEVSREQKSAAGRGAVVGLLGGAAFGIALGASCGECTGTGDKAAAALFLGALFGGLGGGLGALSGMTLHHDTWQPVEFRARPVVVLEAKGIPIQLIHVEF